MESPGEYLRREREQRNITLDAVHEKTRVPKRHLVALEADDYENLPHPTFVKGFIKAYCGMLGLDENDAVLRYDIFTRESGGEYVPSEAPDDGSGDRPVGGGVRASRNNLIIGACVAAGIVLIITFYAVSSRGPSVPEPAPAPVASEEPAVEETASAEKVVEAEPEPEPARVEAASPVAAKPKPSPKAEIKAAAPPAPAPAPAPAKEVKAAAVEPAPQAPAPAPAPEPEKKAAVATGKHTLLAKAIDTVWVQLSIDNGEPFDVMLRSGEELSWTAINEFYLVVGNAAGITIVVDGEEMPPLGEKGEVVRLKLPEKPSAPAAE